MSTCHPASTPTQTLQNDVMCHCSGTRREYIQQLFEQGMDIQAISRWTGALSGCGGCEWDITDLLKRLREQQSATASEQTLDSPE